MNTVSYNTQNVRTPMPAQIKSCFYSIINDTDPYSNRYPYSYSYNSIVSNSTTILDYSLKNGRDDLSLHLAELMFRSNNSHLKAKAYAINQHVFYNTSDYGSALYGRTLELKQKMLSYEVDLKLRNNQLDLYKNLSLIAAPILLGLGLLSLILTPAVTAPAILIVASVLFTSMCLSGAYMSFLGFFVLENTKSNFTKTKEVESNWFHLVKGIAHEDVFGMSATASPEAQRGRNQAMDSPQQQRATSRASAFPRPNTEYASLPRRGQSDVLGGVTREAMPRSHSEGSFFAPADSRFRNLNVEQSNLENRYQNTRRMH